MVRHHLLSSPPRPAAGRCPGLAPSVAALALVFSMILPLKASAVITLPPVNCGGTCSAIEVDGEVEPVEFANGIKAPLQDFATGTFDDR